jgi:putative membrane protein
MKNLSLTIAVAAAIALTSCKPNNPDAGTVAPGAVPAPNADDPAAADVARPSPTPPTESAMGSGDGNALGLLAAVNENEIDAAKQAQEKDVKGAVLDYAKMMDKEHSENLEKTKSLGLLADNDEVKALRAKGANEASTLAQKSGKAYEKAYIDAMVAGHKDALSLIDSKMIPAATTEPVKQHLIDTRTHVERHLAKAEEIQKSL